MGPGRTLEGLASIGRPTGLAAGLGRIIAFGTAGMAVSADGARFVAAAPGLCPISVLATAERLVALGGACNQDPGSRTSDPIVWTSSDGLTWQQVGTASPFGSGAVISAVAARGGRQVAVGLAPPSTSPASASPVGEVAAWVSDDGLAWRRLSPLPGSTCRDASCWPESSLSIAASDRGWLIVDGAGGAWSSADGLGWESLDGAPRIPGGYGAPLLAMSDQLILVGSTGVQVGVGDLGPRDEVAIGVIVGP